MAAKFNSSTSQMHKACNLLRILCMRDFQTGEHSLHVACMAKLFSHYLNKHFGKEKLFIAGLMHDIGKLKMPDFLFQDVIITSEHEKKIITEHPKHTKTILERAEFDPDIVKAAYLHHERWNGTGYPLGLSGLEIPLESRILSILDSYSAITENRPYRKGAEKKHAISILLEDKDNYDQELLTVFIRNINHIENLVNNEIMKYRKQLYLVSS